MYKTNNLGLAAYVLSSKRLPFLKVIPHGKAPADICFEDPNNEGKAVETDFAVGNDDTSASSYHRILRELRRLIQTSIEEQTAAGASRG
jgi:hypothetical protein